MSVRTTQLARFLVLLLPGITSEADGQTVLQIDAAGFRGAIHDNVSNQARQGSGLNPFALKSFPQNLFRDDAVGMNFEHIFNGTKAQRDLSMFTPREDGCLLKKSGPDRFELRWPAEKSQWGLEARMEYDFSVENQVDLRFECTPTKDLFPQRFVAMMWASYMRSAVDRRIHFWGRSGKKVGWTSFGEGEGKNIEIGTVSHTNSAELSHESGAQTLNLFTSTNKKFIAPFYYGVLDADQDFETTDDRLLYLMLFDQTDSIRFAMWNFFANENGHPDTNSPAWDWQYVVRNPEVGKCYRYRARVVIKPFEGLEQVTDEYRKWARESGMKLPIVPRSESTVTSLK